MIDLFFTIEGLVFYFLVLPFLLYFLMVFITHGVKQIISTIQVLNTYFHSLTLVLQTIGAEFIRQFTNAFITKQNDLLDD